MAASYTADFAFITASSCLIASRVAPLSPNAATFAARAAISALSASDSFFASETLCVVPPEAALTASARSVSSTCTNSPALVCPVIPARSVTRQGEGAVRTMPSSSSSRRVTTDSNGLPRSPSRTSRRSLKARSTSASALSWTCMAGIPGN